MYLTFHNPAHIRNVIKQKTGFATKTQALVIAVDVHIYHCLLLIASSHKNKRYIEQKLSHTQNEASGKVMYSVKNTKHRAKLGIV